jgi:hypothetical protein
MKVNNKVYYALGLIGVGFLLLRNPHCKHGCKTMAEHLIADGENGLVAALFA